MPHGPDWVRDAVFYQIFPDRYAASVRVAKPGTLEPWEKAPTATGFKGGDLLGIAEHLDELVELGINALYLNPVFASASNHRYHTYDYELVDPLLGGDAGLRELLDEAHRREMRVLLDGVFNHTGRGFWPFDHVLENGADSPYRDWFYLDRDVLAGRRLPVAYPGRTEAEEMDALRAAGTGGEASGFLSERVFGYRAWWDLPALPKLNHSNPAVREYIYGVAARWLRFGIDGWRLDVPEEIAEPGFWEQFARRCRAIKPDAYLVGEVWTVAPEWLAGRFDGLMNYPLAEAILSFAGGSRLDTSLVDAVHNYRGTVRPIDGAEFGRQLRAAMTAYPPEIASLQLNLLDSHDTPRFLSLAGGDSTALRLAALIQMTLPGAPCVYYGDEVGMAGGADPDCRRAYPWDPARQDRELRDFYARLIALRRSEAVLRRGKWRLLAVQDDAVAYGLFPDDCYAGSTSAESTDSTDWTSSTGSAEGRQRAIVVAVNAGNRPVALNCTLAQSIGPAGHLAEQVICTASAQTIALARRPLERGTLVVDLAPREGVAIGVAQALL